MKNSNIKWPQPLLTCSSMSQRPRGTVTCDTDPRSSVPLTALGGIPGALRTAGTEALPPTAGPGAGGDGALGSLGEMQHLGPTPDLPTGTQRMR